MPRESNVVRGRKAERVARIYLEAQGLQFISQNYYTRYGEIDLVMYDALILVFVEVRMRASFRFGKAVESISTQKQDHVVKTAQHYLQHHREVLGHRCRFDLVAFEGTDFNLPPRWIKGAFRID
ncbi:UPF0102 family protein YraN [Gammaproteobacteria bacterium]